MLSAIREIGELTVQKVIGIDNQIDREILIILIDADKEEYSGIEIEDFNAERNKKNYYLFKPCASKGNVPSPFCPLTEPQKTYKKIQGWLKRCNEIADISEDDRTFIERESKALTKNKDTIISDIEQKIKDSSKKENKFLTVKLNNKYLGEYEVLRKCINHFEETKRKKSASIGVCSICSLPDKEVSGKTDVFKFYTIDKPGFIAGGFQKTLAWKNYPVCLECKTSLENGKKFIESKINFKFYGLNYYLIPRLLIGDKAVLEEIINILADTTKTVALKERIKKRITNDENEILEYLSEKKDNITINFLFLERPPGSNAEKISLLIEDVLPSKIRKIFEAKEYVDKLFGEDFNFGTIRRFFSKSSEGKNKKVNDLNKYFLEIVDSVFKGRRIDLDFLLKFYMVTIRKEFINDGYFIPRVKDALMDTIFFENLGLINFKEVKNMEESIFDTVFKRYGKSFGSPAKRGVFLLGTLTQLLLNKQWSDRKAKPFMKKLKGLKMDEKDIKALLPEVQNKLEEYDSFDKGKRNIATETSKYLLEAGDGWKMSVDEINFYFVCGMNLADDIASVVYPKENNGKEE